MVLFLFRRKKKQKYCVICKNKAVEPRYYVDEQNESLAVCYKCVEYAERRAYRKR